MIYIPKKNEMMSNTYIPPSIGVPGGGGIGGGGLGAATITLQDKIPIIILICLFGTRLMGVKVKKKNLYQNNFTYNLITKPFNDNLLTYKKLRLILT